MVYVLPHLYWALGGDALLFMVTLGPALIWSAAPTWIRAAALAACVPGAATAGSHGAFGIVHGPVNVAG